MLKVAIAGFRHDHILELVNKTKEHSDLELVGCAESDAAARAKTIERDIAVDWTDPFEMIEKLPCDIVGIGDVYAKRGGIAIAALMHDVCKVNFYKTSFRNAKDETGKWVSVPYYTIEDNLPYGHGEKSVYIVSGFMRLTRDEAFAIRYHMGFSGTEDPGNVGRALEMFPLAYALCCADMEAAFLMEGKLAGDK